MHINNLELNISELNNRDFNFDKNNKLFLTKNGIFKVGQPESGSISDLSIVATKLQDALCSQKLSSENSFLKKNISSLNHKIEKRNDRLIHQKLFFDNILAVIFNPKISAWQRTSLVFQYFFRRFGFAKEESPLSKLFLQKKQFSLLYDFIKKEEPIAIDDIPRKRMTIPIERRGEELYQNGYLAGFKGPSICEHLEFVPDYELQMTRKTRAKIAATATLIAPKQPEGRPFEYVGFGSGKMLQDLHQVVLLIKQGVTHIHVSLIDIAYREGAFNINFGREKIDKEACLNEFNKIIKQVAPEATITIDLYSSADRWHEKHPNPQFDLLTAIRVPTTLADRGWEEVKEDLTKLEEAKAPNSSLLICDTRGNHTIMRCFREGQEIAQDNLSNPLIQCYELDKDINKKRDAQDRTRLEYCSKEKEVQPLQQEIIRFFSSPV